MTRQNTFRLSILSAALFTALNPVYADEIAALTKPDSSISFSAGTWTEDRPQQGIYDGQRDSGPVGSVDVNLTKRNDETGTWLSLKGRDLGVEPFDIRAEYLRQGNVGFSIEQSRITRDNPYTFFTGLLGIGTPILTQSGPGVNALPINEVSLGTKRDITEIGFYKNLMENLDARLSFKHDDKTGTRHWGRGGQPAFAVEPIDSTIDQLELSLNYSGEQLQLSGGYYGSWYKNNFTYVDMINQGANPATFNNHTYLSLPLDNESHQMFLNGGYNFTSATRGTFKLEYSEATQDENLPTNSILNMPLAAGVPASLNGKLVTTLAQAAVSSRLASNWSASASIRYHDLKDKTPENRFVIGAGAGACVTSPPAGNQTCTDNTPYSYTTTTGKAETTYRLPDGYGLTGSVEQRIQDRSVPLGQISTAGASAGLDPQRLVPYRDQLDELTWKLELRRSLSETANGSVSYAYSERDGTDWISAAGGPGGAVSNQINPIHLADRNRQKLRMAGDWSPTEQFSLQGVFEYSSDDYKTSEDRPYGLQDGLAKLFTVDATYNPSENLQFNAWFGLDKNTANQLNLNAFNGSLMRSNLVDTGKSFGAGVKGKPTGKLTAGLDVQMTRTNSEYNQNLRLTGASLPTSQLPDIENEVTQLKLFAEMKLDKENTVRADFIHERWQTNDWSWQFRDGSPFIYTGAGNSAATYTDGTTVRASPDQSSNYIGVRYTYNFQ